MASIGVLLFFYLTQGSVSGGKAGYLYSPDPSKGEKLSDVSPIIDYVQPERRIGESQKDYDERRSHPLFLTKEEKEDRIVEFYAAWCGHCQHYKPKYIKIARDVNKVRTLTFHAVPCPIHGKICKDQNVRGYPTVKFFPAGSDEGVVLKHSIGANGILIDFLHVDKTEVESKLKGKEKTLRNATDKKNTKQQPTDSTTSGSVFGDAALSLYFGLKSSVYVTPDASRSRVLRRWLELLVKSLPVEMSTLKDHATTLMTVDIDETFQSETKLLQYLPDKSQVGWSENCSKGVSGAGYTCGLWELFHILTIGVVEWNVKSQDRIATTDAADAIRDYVEYFFMCDECRQNFLTMYDACQFQRCERLNSDVSDDAMESWKQLPLWLWETHNDVNVRLMAEERKEKGLPQATLEQMQMARWPSTRDCPSCWMEGGGWDEEEVYKMLHSYYWGTKSVFMNDIAEEYTRVRIASSQEFIYLKSFVALCCILWFLYYQKQKRMLVSVQRRKSK